MPVSSGATIWLSKPKLAFCVTFFTTVLTKCNPDHVSCTGIRKLVFYMSKEQVIGKRYERRGEGKYGGSFSPFISEQLGPISQPEWIKESEMDCVDCSFVLLNYFFFFFFAVTLQCQIHDGIDSPVLRIAYSETVSVLVSNLVLRHFLYKPKVSNKSTINYPNFIRPGWDIGMNVAETWMKKKTKR